MLARVVTINTERARAEQYDTRYSKQRGEREEREREILKIHIL
jgi:hypothetical protein